MIHPNFDYVVVEKREIKEFRGIALPEGNSQIPVWVCRAFGPDCKGVAVIDKAYVLGGMTFLEVPGCNKRVRLVKEEQLVAWDDGKDEIFEAKKELVV